MTKLKKLIITFSILMITVILESTNNLSNFNSEIQNDDHHLKFLDDNFLNSENFRRDVGPDHGAKYFYLEGFYWGLHIYNNVTHKNECLSFLPDLHDDIVDIYYKFKNSTRDSDFIELIRYTLKKLDHIFQRIQDTREDCKIFKSEIREVNRDVCNYLHKQDHLFRKIIDHFLKNKDVVKNKIEKYKDRIRNKLWWNAGYLMGDLLNFIFIWDYRE